MAVFSGKMEGAQMSSISLFLDCPALARGHDLKFSASDRPCGHVLTVHSHDVSVGLATSNFLFLSGKLEEL